MGGNSPRPPQLRIILGFVINNKDYSPAHWSVKIDGRIDPKLTFTFTFGLILLSHSVMRE